MLRIFTILGLTVIFLAGGASQSKAMYLLSALGTPDVAEIAETIMEDHAAEAAKVEPAAGENTEK